MRPFYSIPWMGTGWLGFTRLTAKPCFCGCREMPEGKGVPSEIGSYGLSVHTQGAGRRQPAGPRGLGCKRTSNLAVVGSSLISSPSSLPQLSPFIRRRKIAVEVSSYCSPPAIMFAVATPCHCPTERDHLVSRPWLSQPSNDYS